MDDSEKKPHPAEPVLAALGMVVGQFELLQNYVKYSSTLKYVICLIARELDGAYILSKTNGNANG